MRPRTLLLLLLIAVCAFFLGRHGWLGQPALDQPALVREVQQLKELATVRYTVQKVVGVKEQKVPFGEESLLLIVQGKVIGGIDLGRLRPEDVQVAKGRVIITLPGPQIQQVYLDEKETKVWDRRITWWTPWVPYSPDLEHRARLTAIEDVRRTAEQMGILQEARRNAESLIRELLRNAGVRETQFLPGLS